jgi:dihydrofolate reductase
MSRTQFYTATSIDGFLADPDNSLSWLFEVPADTPGPPGYAEFFAAVGAMAMGATTYEWILAYEGALAHPEKWTAFYGDKPCWVFTHRDLPAVPGANIRFASGPVRPVHEDMVAAAGGRNIWLVGGGDLVGAFADEGLLDELVLQVAPVTLGAGAPLLPRRLTSSRLSLREVGRSGQFALLTYDVKPSA